ncbi:hypothetical protein [Plantibacter sp. YIM 135249]|uniref:hypothetical protein n=1 Tax=Plantibacter sp. YIM 135249 TaxID=3423918 RepID=UPI003D33E695
MTFPSYVDQIRESAQSSGRTGSIVRRIWHHQASTNDDATIAMMVSGSKEVSANQTVDNKSPAGDPRRAWARITGVVSNERRAWTSSSAMADGRALTAEVCNESGAPGYNISEATYAACALMAADDYLTLGIPLKRATKDDPTGHLGHNEVLGMFGDGYATSCPLHLDIDRIISDATTIVNGGIAALKGIEMPALLRHPNSSIGFVSDAGELDAISDINEVEALKASGIVKDWVQLPDGFVWNLLTKRTARLRAQRAGTVDEAAIAKQIAPLVVAPIIAAIQASGQIGTDPEAIAKITEDAVRRVFADAAAPR